MGYINRHFVTLIVLFAIVSWSNGAAIKEGKSTLPAASTAAPGVLPVWLAGDFSTSLTDHFCVAHDAGSVEAIRLAGRLEYAFEHFRLFFEQFGFELQAPRERLSWISFTDRDDFSHYAKRADSMDLSRLSGYYSAKTNRVVIVGTPLKTPLSVQRAATVDTAGDIAAMAGDDDPNHFVKISHELAHQLAFNTGLQKRGVMYPIWVSEGLATQYETKLSYCQSSNTARSSRLSEMRTYGRLIPLEELIVATRLPAQQYLCEDLYAEAWGFFNFLLEKHPQQLKQYLSTLYNGKSGFRDSGILGQEFMECFGPVDQLRSEWFISLSAQ